MIFLFWRCGIFCFSFYYILRINTNYKIVHNLSFLPILLQPDVFQRHFDNQIYNYGEQVIVNLVCIYQFLDNYFRRKVTDHLCGYNYCLHVWLVMSEGLFWVNFSDLGLNVVAFCFLLLSVEFIALKFDLMVHNKKCP